MIEIIRIHNELLGTYGDKGNAEILAHRARARGFDAKITDISYRNPIPTSGDIYLLGGAEDAAQILSVEKLKQDRGLVEAVNKGAHLLAICAAYQIIGESFYAENRKIHGLGLIPVETLPGDKAPNNSPNTQRFVGDISIECHWLKDDIKTVTGFENHGGYTKPLHSNIQTFGKVNKGFGNGDCLTDGVVLNNIYATYLHGPLLARNPQVADHLLSSILNSPLESFNDSIANELATERRDSFK